MSQSLNTCAYVRERTREAPSLVNRLAFLRRNLESTRIFADAEESVDIVLEMIGCPRSFRDSQLYHCLKVGINTYLGTAELVIRLRDSGVFTFRNLPGYFYHQLKYAEKFLKLDKRPYRFLPAFINEHFYDPSIFNEIELAVDEALAGTHGKEAFRDRWIALCLKLGILAFQDRLYEALSCTRQGEVRKTAGFLFARIIKDQQRINK